tara:strand:- start:358 stop:849 length:492 start_codon:yes stop_codon:yes gene_type:complete
MSLHEDERPEAFDEHGREQRRLKKKPHESKIRYWFTRAYGMPGVRNRADARREWDRNRGCMHLYCPAIIKIDGAERTAFLDLSHVHGGFYEQPMPHFSLDAYPRCDGKDHRIVLDGAQLGSALNITKNWGTFAVEDQVRTVAPNLARSGHSCSRVHLFLSRWT